MLYHSATNQHSSNFVKGSYKTLQTNNILIYFKTEISISLHDFKEPLKDLKLAYQFQQIKRKLSSEWHFCKFCKCQCLLTTQFEIFSSPHVMEKNKQKRKLKKEITFTHSIKLLSFSHFQKDEHSKVKLNVSSIQLIYMFIQ